MRVSCLALDVADPDINSLQRAYDRFVEKLKTKEIPSEKLSFVAKAVKFPTPEAMFDFIGALPDFLKTEGVSVPQHYMPWLSSAMEIPPLAGGVGRRRALSKGIYGLNYYYLKVIDGFADSFKESVAASTVQPVVFVIFGVGGGSGGGMAVDFVRHLRKKMGSSYPIIGLGILPCSGDDPPAKGASAYAALNELELLLDRNKNDVVKRSYGEMYANPFTAFIMMPLGPPYMKTGSLVDAKELLDEAIVDILMNSLRFDLSDLLNNIGSTLHLDDRWIHTLSSLKITYPVHAHIALTKLYLERMDKLRPARVDKIEICGAQDEDNPIGIMKLINYTHDDLIEVFRQLQINRGIYEENSFEKNLSDYLSEDKSLELDVNVQVKGMEDSIQSLLNDLSLSTLSIGLEAPEGTPKARLHGLVKKLVDETASIVRTHLTYHELAVAMDDDLNSAIAGTPKITLKQKLLLNDLLDTMKLVDSYLMSLRRYVETKSLASRLFKDLTKADRNDVTQKLLTTTRRIQNPELVVVFSLLSSLFNPPSSELKTIDSHLSAIKSVKRMLNDRVEQIKRERDGLETRVRSQQNEVSKITNDLGRSKAFKTGKKQLQEKLDEFKHSERLFKAQLEELDLQLTRSNDKLKEYTDIERRYEINSDYRKNLRDAIDLAKDHYDQLNELSRDRGYYDRVAEIGEEERLRITQRILDEEEESLTRETMLNEIVDKRRMKEYLNGTMRMLRIPSTLGVTDTYRTDFIWVTVVAPRGVWDADGASEMKAALSGYISGDAGKCIVIREVNSEDPWTIRFLVIAGRAKQQELDIYNEMKALYESSPKGDRVLAHSFLLEQGVIATADSIKNMPVKERRVVP